MSLAILILMKKHVFESEKWKIYHPNLRLLFFVFVTKQRVSKCKRDSLYRMNMKYPQIQQTNQVNVTQYLYSYDFHNLLTNIITQSCITYLKWFVSKKNANKVVKIFTSCRFIPPAFCDDLENIPEIMPERCREKVSWCCLDSQIQQ